MLVNAINPYWWMPEVLPSNNVDLPRIDVGGIYKLSTNAVALSDASVDYGINPCLYNRLPCESIVLLSVHSDVPEGGALLPAALVVPNSGSSTVTTAGANNNTGTTRLPIVDSQGTGVTGANIQGSTERLVYINKRTGMVRFMEFTNATA